MFISSKKTGEKAKPSQIESLLKNSEFYIETKYDGERFQLHKQGSNFAYFSRNSNEKYSENFGQDRHSGSLTPYIYNCFSKDVKVCLRDLMIILFNFNHFFNTQGLDNRW